MSRDRKKKGACPPLEVDTEIDFGAIDRLLEGVLGAIPDADGSAGACGCQRRVPMDARPRLLVAPESYPFGTLQLIATPDRLSACLELEVHDWTALDREVVLQILRQRVPKCRIDRLALEKGLEDACRRRLERCRVAVASATPPAKGAPAEVAYPFERAAGKDAQEVWDSFDLLPEMLCVSDVKRLVELHPLVYLTTPGEVLAVKTPAGVGDPGEDIFGELLPPEAGEDLKLKAGKNVAASQDGLRLTAERFGYLHIRGDEVSVLSPVCVSPDGLEGYFLILPRANRETAIGAKEIAALLEASGVVNGVLDDKVQQIGTGPCDDSRAIVVARGTRPIPGTDARLNFAVDIESRHGTVLKDGSIDFRQRNIAAGVSAGDLIVERVLPTHGQDGRRVTGETIPAKDGEDRSLRSGQNVRMEMGEKGERLYAEVDGRVAVRDGAVHVLPILNIRGNVDYRVGNIEFSGDVVIGGTVRSGFSVKAGGSVTVRGHVEDGAFVRGKGPVTVCGGILGQDTRVISGESVMAKFVQEAWVEAAGELVVGSYMFNAKAVAREVRVEGRGAVKGGAVVGGSVWGARRIETRSAGSALTSNTTLVAGRDPGVEDQLRKTRKNLALCASKILTIAKVLGVSEVTEKSIRQVVDHAPPGRRDFLLPRLEELRGFIEAKEKSRQEEDRLRKIVEKTANAAEIRIARTAFSGTQIRIGEAERRLSEDIVCVTFKKVGNRIVW